MTGKTSVLQVVLSRDKGGNQTTAGFATTDNPLYCVVVTDNQVEGTSLKINWVALNAGGERNARLLERSIILSAEDRLGAFSASLPRPWPEGDYLVEVELNGQLAHTQVFNIGRVDYTGLTNLLLSTSSNRDGSGVVGCFTENDNPLYLMVETNNQVDGTELRVNWIALEAGGEKDLKILESEVTMAAEEQVATFSARLPRAWPAGNYKTTVFINGRIVAERFFTIGL